MFLGNRAPSLSSGNQIQLHTIIGGTSSSDTFTFDLKWIHIHQGVPRLLSTEEESNCAGAAVGTDPCKMYSYGTGTARFFAECLDCKDDPAVTFVFSTQRIICKEGPPPSDLVKRTSSIHQNLYDSCPVGKFSDSGSCGNCVADCVVCNSDADCQVCDWSKKLKKDGSNCVACSAGKYFVRGYCIDCLHFCINCDTSCTSVPVTGAQIFYRDRFAHNYSHYVMCDLNTHTPYYEISVYPSYVRCDLCPSSCDGCSRKGITLGRDLACLDCKAPNAYNYQTGECVTTCNGHNGKYYDANTSTCKDCSTGCKRCLDGIY